MRTEGVSRRAVVMAGACLTGLALVPAGLGSAVAGVSLAQDAEAFTLAYAVSIATASEKLTEIHAAVRVGGPNFASLTKVLYPARVGAFAPYLHQAMHSVDTVIIHDAARRLRLPRSDLRIGDGCVRHAVNGTAIAPIMVWASV